MLKIQILNVMNAIARLVVVVIIITVTTGGGLNV